MYLTDFYKPYQHGAIYRGAPHTERELTHTECKEIMHAYRAWFVRNVYNFDCKDETSFWFVIQDKPLKIEDLPSKCRNQVRRSLKSLLFSKIDRESFVKGGGYFCYLESFKRYKVKTSAPMSEERFNNHIASVPDNTDFWVAIEQETKKMIAYAEVLCQDGCAKYTALKGIPEFLNKYYPFYGLLFVMNKYYIDEHGYQFVTDGARSISEHSNIQTFLEKFRFRKAYCHLNVTYVWWLKVIIDILYPFRNLFCYGKLGYLLRFEAINRNQY